MRKLFLLTLTVAFLSFISVFSAGATMIGDEVHLEHQYTGLANPVLGSGDVTGAGSWVFNYDGKHLYDVVIGSNSITIAFTRSYSYNADYSANGLFVSGVDTEILGLSSTSNVTSGTAGFDFTSGGISIDLRGVSVSYGDSLIATLDFGGAVGGDDGDGSGGEELDTGDTPNSMANPVPAPILLLGTGLFGLAGFRRKNRAN